MSFYRGFRSLFILPSVTACIALNHNNIRRGVKTYRSNVLFLYIRQFELPKVDFNMENELEIKPKRKGKEFFSQGNGNFSGINSEKSSDLVCPLQRRQQ